MKNVKAFTAILSLSLLAAGCGEYSKSPVSDLDYMRQNQTNPENNKSRVERVEVPVETAPQTTVVEQAKPDANAIRIKPQLDMTFSEGAKATFKVQSGTSIPGLEIKLNFSGLPDGLKAEPSTTEKGTYLLTWTPPYNTLGKNEFVKKIFARVSAQIVSGPKQVVETLKTFDFSQDFMMMVIPAGQAPAELTVADLPQSVTEGTLVPFTITVVTPGLDNSTAQKPDLLFSYDVNFTDSNAYIEMDGSRHVSLDLTKKAPEYLGNYKWKFTRIFDTKNTPPQTQIGKDGQPIKSADGTYTRMTVKVIGARNTATPEQTLRVKIAYNKPADAPRFNVAGLAQDALEIARGQKVTVNFLVASADATSVVKVDSIKSSLPGKTPELSCKDSATGAATQECAINWTVPCDTQDAKLNGEVTMTAYAVIGGRNSEVTTYKLKVVPSKVDQKLCGETTPEVKPETKPETKPEVKKTPVKPASKEPKKASK